MKTYRVFPRKTNGTPDDLEPLIEAGKLFNDAGINIKKRNAYAYVLIGGHGDTIDKAEKRLNEAINAGFIPFAMLYRDDSGRVKDEWVPFAREWSNMFIIGSKLKRLFPKLSIIPASPIV